jgi:hypothetical protein
MKLRVFLGLALLIPGLAWSANLNTAIADPRIGYWIEDKISATYPQAQGLQVSFDDLGGGLIRYKLGANHTPATVLQVDARCDGGQYSFVDGTGKPDGRMYSCRVTGTHTVESTSSNDKASPGLTSTLVETVSADGTSLTGVGTYRDASGKVVREVRRHFTRR